MARRRGRFLRSLEELIEIRRYVPENLVPNLRGTSPKYKEDCDELYEEIAKDQKIIILENKNIFDEQGFTLTEVEYIGNIRPRPDYQISSTDIVIRPSRNNQKLVVSGVNLVKDVLTLTLVNYEKLDHVHA